MSFIVEILSMFSHHIDQYTQKFSQQVWTLVLASGLALISVLLIFTGLGFLGYSLYHHLAECVGQSIASLIAGGFFILIALILLIISKKMIRK